MASNEGVSIDERKALKNASDSVVFESQAYYDCCLTLLLPFAPTITFVKLVAYVILAPEERATIVGITISFFFILVLYALVLPKKYEVLPDAAVQIVSISGARWKFNNVTAAYEKDSLMSEWYRPKFKFATSIRKNRVVVRRRNGAWDLLVSPAEPEGFINAVWNVSENERTEHPELASKPVT